MVPAKYGLETTDYAPNTVKKSQGLFSDLEEIDFRQSAIGVTTRKALETASARIVSRMIRKGIFEN